MAEEQVTKTQHIWCSAVITKKMEDVLVGFICNQAQSSVGVSEYIIYLSTLGGSPFCAVNLYSFIKSIPQKQLYITWEMFSRQECHFSWFSK